MQDFELGFIEPESCTEKHFYIFSGHSVLKLVADQPWRPLTQAEWAVLSLPELSQHYIGSLGNTACIAVEVDEVEAPAGYKWSSLRGLMFNPDQHHFMVAGRGAQIIEWARTHKFCGSCGRPMVDSDMDRARRCEPCKRSYYPRLSPCVIMLVTRGEQLLLAQGVNFRGSYYSALAGFVESGETLEAAVRREVFEEVGIQVDNIRYFGSQPWPFPHQLMLGFHAEYAGGELNPDPEEIVDAAWFHYTELPDRPPATAIAGQLIDHTIAQLAAKAADK